MKSSVRTAGIVIILVAAVAFSASLTGCRGSRKTSSTVEIDGPVTIKVSGSSVWKPLDSGDKVSQGDCLKTGAESGGTVSVKDDTINLRMGRSTEVEVERLGTRDGRPEIHLRIHGGDTFSQIDKGSARFFVRTPVAVMGVIGTAFQATVDGDTGATRVAVVDGSVSVTVGVGSGTVGAGSGTVGAGSGAVDEEKTILKRGRFMQIDASGLAGKPKPLVLADEVFDGQPLVSFFNDKLRSALQDLLESYEKPGPSKKKPPRPKKKRPGVVPRFRDSQPEETRSGAGMDVDPGSTGSDLPPWAAPGPPPDDAESIQEVLDD